MLTIIIIDLRIIGITLFINVISSLNHSRRFFKEAIYNLVNNSLVGVFCIETVVRNYYSRGERWVTRSQYIDFSQNSILNRDPG